MNSWKQVLDKLGHLLPHGHGDLQALMQQFHQARQMRTTRDQLHVLLVEDDPVTRRMASCLLQQQDYIVLESSNAEEALQHYLLHAPDIVFLDIGLPGSHGLSVLKQIVELDPQAYVVMLTAQRSVSYITYSMAAGARGFIPKPFRPEMLKHYVSDCIWHRTGRS